MSTPVQACQPMEHLPSRNALRAPPATRRKTTLQRKRQYL
ncbi:hypothetical protein SAMN05444507_105254 [Pseudomonas syringae]|nr:hypothetical protein SAMN05444507_105254 [Pseudomonas syringae]